MARLFRTSRVATNGRNLVLPFGEAEKAEVAQIIDQEAAEGKIQVEVQRGRWYTVEGAGNLTVNPVNVRIE